MKLCQLPIALRTAEARSKIEDDIGAVEQGLVILQIVDRPQDAAMVAAVKTAMLAELRGRKAELERDLRSYGVEVTA